MNLIVNDINFRKPTKFFILYLVPANPTKKFIIGVIVFRFINSITSRNCMHTDEFNNLIDIAYHLVYRKNNFLSLEWTESFEGMPMRLRNVLYP